MLTSTIGRISFIKFVAGIQIVALLLLLSDLGHAQRRIIKDRPKKDEKENKSEIKSQEEGQSLAAKFPIGSVGNSSDADADEEHSTPPILTGVPQIDYIHDPNLPHELIGYDLSDYPFYKRVPKEGHNFTCDGRHDGFYASIPHKCQVYYNCLFGQRYDFLCANYTVFDQVNFICHYASEVDCLSSEKYYDRNEELYVTTTTTTKAPPKIVYLDRPRPRPLRPINTRRPLINRRRPRPPAVAQDQPPQDTKDSQDAQYYDYYGNNDYYDQNYYNDDYYYYDQPSTTTTTTRRPIPQRRRRPGPGFRQGGGAIAEGQGRLRRPGAERGGQAGTGPRRQRPRLGAGGEVNVVRRKRPKTTTTTTAAPPEYEYYYDDYYYDDAAQPKVKPQTTTEAPQTSTKRLKPTQFRRPNFRRSENLDEVEENVSVNIGSAVESLTNDGVNESVIEERVENKRRQFNRRTDPSPQLIRTRPVNSSGLISSDNTDSAAAAVQETASAHDPTSQPQANSSTNEAANNVQNTDSIDNLSIASSRLGDETGQRQFERDQTSQGEELGIVPRLPRPIGQGFGGRRPRV